MCNECKGLCAVRAPAFIANNCLGFSFISVCVAVGLSEVDINRLSKDKSIDDLKLEQIANFCEWSADQTEEFKRIISM